jgi:hypothetical protein
MKKRNLKYVVLDARSGGSWLLYGDGGRPEDLQPEYCDTLPRLLEEGWIPVREVPVGAAAEGVFNISVQAPVLILLEKTTD